ncbi:MAG: redoxin domain-containing protein [Candidatus Atribacteria bacterium]|nr:redoxin domain-containing protein [Candidatus Atribacteria bacterium]
MKKTLYPILVVNGAIIILYLLSGCSLFPNTIQTPSTPVPSPASTSSVVESPNAVNFTLPDLNGNEISLSEFRGKPVLLTLFSYSCPHCRNEVPQIERIYNQYHDSKSLVVLGIGVSSSISELEQFRAQYGLSFPILYDPGRVVYHQFFSSGIPALVLINTLGEVAYSYNSSELSGAEIEQLLLNHIL